MYAARVTVDVRLLSALRERLPIPIPEPEWVSTEHPVIGYAKLRGQSLEERDLVGAVSECERLGQFLDTLHRFPVDEGLRLGLDPETPKTWRAGWVRAWERYRRALALLPERVRQEAQRRWEEFLANDDNFEFEPALIHADLRPQHVLWERGRVTGVIDWSDAQIGDVEMDFAWPLSLPSTAASSILNSYFARDVKGLHERARFYEWTGWWSEAVHGLETDDPSYVERGVAGVMRQIE